MIIIERNQVAPADLLVLDISGRSAAKDLSYIDQQEPEMLIPPTTTVRTPFYNLVPKKSDCSQLTPQYLRMMNMTITVVGNNHHQTATLKLKGNPETETVGHQAFMPKDSKLMHSEWAIAVVVARDSSVEYYRHLFRKSRFLQEYNPLILKLLAAEVILILFTMIIQRKIYSPMVNNPLTSQLVHRCININFHLPLIYIIYDLLDIVYTLVRLWKSVLEKDYFFESENNLEIMTSKLVMDPLVLAEKKYMEVTGVMTARGLVDIGQSIAETLEDEIDNKGCTQ